MAILEFTRRYSMAHRLLADPASRCATPHGHNETVTIQVAPRRALRLGGANMLTPFETVKRRWAAWIDDAVDHAFQLDRNDPLVAWFRANEPQRLARIMTFDGDPTTEALAAMFWCKLNAFLRADDLPYDVASVRVQETPTNAVLLAAPIEGELSIRWPMAADMSINDFVSHQEDPCSTARGQRGE